MSNVKQMLEAKHFGLHTLPREAPAVVSEAHAMTAVIDTGSGERHMCCEDKSQRLLCLYSFPTPATAVVASLVRGCGTFGGDTQQL